MRYPSLLVVCFFSVVAVAFGQPGHFFLTHHSPSDEKIDPSSHAMAQDDRGILYFANKNGVLEFDGRHWLITPTAGAVHALANLQQQVYAGGVFGFGRLGAGSGSRNFELLEKTEEPVLQLVPVDSGLLVVSTHRLFRWNIASNQGTDIPISPLHGALQRVFTLDAEYFLQSSTGLWKIGTSLESAALSGVVSPVVVAHTEPVSRKTLIGTADGKFFVGTSRSDWRQLPYLPEISASVMVEARWVSDQLVAVGTLRSGVFFVDVDSGEMVEHTYYGSGLPDDEVTALFTDRSLGVWVAHDYGYTRISPYVPLRSYNHYPGLQGNFLCAISWKGSVWVGTTVGVWQLQVRDEGLIKGKAKSPVPAYTYVRLPGIEGKISQLFTAEGRLIAAGSAGLFEIEGAEVHPFVNEPVRTAFFSPTLRQVFVSTYGNELHSFQRGAREWQPTRLLDTVRLHISYMFEDKLENLWLCASNEVLKVEIVDESISDIVRLPIDNPALDETVGLAYGSQVYVAASGRFRVYDSRSDSFLPYDSLPGPRKYFASAGNFWFNDGARWRTVDRRMQTMKLEWLALFPQLRFLSLAEGGLWVITASNELYKLTNDWAGASGEEHYPLILRDIRGVSGSFAPRQTILFQQEEGTVTFEFIQPDYVGAEAISYRYWVKGLGKSWSAWSPSHNLLNFSYLPPGSYQLQVQSKSLLGVESAIQTVSFEVLAPYWKRAWFYALEFVVFATLVALAIRLGNLGTRFRLVSRLLSILTIVLLIEFIQTAASSWVNVQSSPVSDFVIQVVVALTVFPVEHYLRKIMFRSAERRFQTEHETST